MFLTYTRLFANNNPKELSRGTKTKDNKANEIIVLFIRINKHFILIVTGFYHIIKNV